MVMDRDSSTHYMECYMFFVCIYEVGDRYYYNDSVTWFSNKD